jgi:hypothetical protein
VNVYFNCEIFTLQIMGTNSSKLSCHNSFSRILLLNAAKMLLFQLHFPKQESIQGIILIFIMVFLCCFFFQMQREMYFFFILLTFVYKKRLVCTNTIELGIIDACGNARMIFSLTSMSVMT